MPVCTLCVFNKSESSQSSHLISKVFIYMYLEAEDLKAPANGRRSARAKPVRPEDGLRGLNPSGGGVNA